MPSLPHPLHHQAKQAHVTTPPQVPMSRHRSSQRPGATRPPTPALMGPTPSAALSLVLPDQHLPRDTKVTYPGRSFLGSNRSRESLFSNSTLKPYNSKGGRLGPVTLGELLSLGWEELEAGPWGVGVTGTSHYLSIQGEEQPLGPCPGLTLQPPAHREPEAPGRDAHPHLHVKVRAAP